MFASRYFPNRYFAPRYWSKVGSDEVILAGGYSVVIPRRAARVVVVPKQTSVVSR